MSRTPSLATAAKWRGTASSLLCLAFLNACAAVLPATTETADSPWNSFEAAKAAYDSIVPTQTTTAELTALGYDPYATPNVQVLSYVEIIQRFLPRDTTDPESLDSNLRACIEAREHCWGYEVVPGVTDRQRQGNVLLDIFGFKRTTVTTGWRFTALIVLKGEVVQYKIWGGTPKIAQQKVETKPLGPLQELDRIIQPQPFTVP